MPDTHLGLVADAKKACTAVFSDKSVDARTTKDSLEEIRDEIDVMVEAIESDLERDE